MAGAVEEWRDQKSVPDKKLVGYRRRNRVVRLLERKGLDFMMKNAEGTEGAPE